MTPLPVETNDESPHLRQNVRINVRQVKFINFLCEFYDRLYYSSDTLREKEHVD